MTRFQKFSASRRKAGRCYRCANPAVDGTLRCEQCREKAKVLATLIRRRMGMKIGFGHGGRRKTGQPSTIAILEKRLFHRAIKTAKMEELLRVLKSQLIP